jgi:hypothetical protein
MATTKGYTSHDGIDRKLNVPTSQALSMPKGYRHYVQKISSATTPSFGSWFTIRVTEKGVALDGVTLEFQTSALTGLTVTNSGTAALPAAHLWVDRIDIYVGTQLIESLSGMANFLTNQLLAHPMEEKRTMANVAAGVYNSHTIRATKSASTEFWYLPIASFFNQSSYPLLSTADLEFRIQLSPLASIYTLTTGSTATGTPACTINSCQAICQFSRLPQSIANYTSSLLAKSPLHFGFKDIQAQTFTVASGVTSTSLVLSAINGCVSTIIFCIRSASPVNNNVLTFNTTMSSFEILSGSSENIVGGQPITDILSRYVQGQRFTNTLFLNDGPGTYMYSHSIDPVETFNSSAQLGAHQYTGGEILRLNFSTALAAAAQVDVFALTHAAIEMTPSGVKKLSLSV